MCRREMRHKLTIPEPSSEIPTGYGMGTDPGATLETSRTVKADCPLLRAACSKARIMRRRRSARSVQTPAGKANSNQGRYSASAVITGLIGGMTADEIRHHYDLTAVEYDTMRRRIRRAMLRHGLAWSWP